MPIVPPGKVVVVMDNGAAALTVMVIARLKDKPAASVTSHVTELLLAPVGVPVIAPVLLPRLSPAGSVPEVMVHLNGLVPPFTLRVAL